MALPLNPAYSQTSQPLVPSGTSRRTLLQSVAAGFGWLAFAGLNGLAASPSHNPQGPKTPHFTPKARRIIFLCMQGGPSHLDTFDFKPRLTRDHGLVLKGRGAAGGAKIQGSPFTFKQQGQAGLWMSDLFPCLAQRADDLCIIRSMHTDIPNHPQALIQLHTGSARFVRPSMGAWVLYGLGTENSNLPGFITLNPPTQFGAQNYGSAFLPASHQGTRLNASGSLSNSQHPFLNRPQQRRQLDLIQAMNLDFSHTTGAHPEVEGAIQSFELAFRMQSEMPQVMDLKTESPQTLERYGIGTTGTDGFGRQCLLARRMAEAGVRFIELNQGGWDQHQNLTADMQRNAYAIDRPIAALLSDLKERGLLQDTLVIWGGEFGRTPDSRRDDGRDHNAKGFTFWLAGGGTRPGFQYGATDELGAEAVENRVHIHDLHATALHLLGLDHERLTFRYGGRNHRLTDVKGQVVQAIVA